MDDVVIRVEGLGKRYVLGKRQSYKTLRDTLAGAMLAPYRVGRALTRFGRRDPSMAVREFWALKDASFEVKRGEAVGVIGSNGAGKSTLLKILARVTEPTEGWAEIQGRVGALLEVGTGFHPELTGRENIFLNGAILGMRKAEIARKFDEIVAFAEVDKFIDTAVKFYSSGMYVRLAFAVAAYLEPEVLVVDEVLAVGDSAFQEKCLGKMRSVSQGGRTVLFVSHNMAAMLALTTRVLWLDGGKVVLSGTPTEVIRRYLAKTLQSQGPLVDLGSRPDRSGDGIVRLESFQVADMEGNPVAMPQSGDGIQFVIGYSCKNNVGVSGVTFEMDLFNNEHQRIAFCRNDLVGTPFDKLEDRGEVVCSFPRLPLMPGQYTLDLACRVRGVVSDWVQSAANLHVAEGRYYQTGRLPPKSHGDVLLDYSWSKQQPSALGRKASVRGVL